MELVLKQIYEKLPTFYVLVQFRVGVGASVFRDCNSRFKVTIAAVHLSPGDIDV
jgi:hypothetical protein